MTGLLQDYPPLRWVTRPMLHIKSRGQGASALAKPTKAYMGPPPPREVATVLPDKITSHSPHFLDGLVQMFRLQDNQAYGEVEGWEALQSTTFLSANASIPQPGGISANTSWRYRCAAALGPMHCCFAGTKHRPAGPSVQTDIERFWEILGD